MPAAILTFLWADPGCSTEPVSAGVGIAGSPRETIEEFRKLQEPNPETIKRARELRDVYDRQLRERRERDDSDLAYYATFLHYQTALDAMNEAVFAAVDHGAARDDKSRRRARILYLSYQAQLDLLVEEIDRLEKEFGD